MANLGRAVLFKQLDRLYRDGSFTSQDDAQLLERYLSGRDDGAFETIVNLHGPMILALCRRILRDPRDIEDAFQATFLILARRADTIRKRDVLSSWLYGVAYRVAVRCRSEVLRRRSFETTIPGLETPDRSAASACDEVGPALDQELSRLPEKYRAPIVLCYLREQTHDQAAAALRWPVGTVRSRLARGRELLKARLTRRGYAPAGAVLGFGPRLPAGSFTAVVPQPLVEATVAAIGRCAWSAGPAILFPSLTIPLSGSATTLAQGVLTTMALSQIKWIGAGMAALGVLAGGAGAWALAAARPGEQGDKAPAAKAVEKAAAKQQLSDLPSPGPRDLAPQAGGHNVEARLADLERKLDQLLRLLAGKSINTPAEPPPVAPTDLGPLPSSAHLAGAADTAPVPGREVAEVPAPARTSQPLPDLPPSTSLPQATDLPTSRVEAPQAPAADLPRTEASPFELDARQARSTVERSPSDVDMIPPARQAGRRQRRVLPSPSSPPVAPSDSDAVPRPEFPPDARESRPVDIQYPTRTSLKEIQAQLYMTRIDLERNETLFKSGVVGKDQCDRSLGQIRVLIGRLEGWDEELADEAERLIVEAARKKAEVQVAEAQIQVAEVVVARNKRLNERKPGMVSQEEVAKGEAEYRRAAACLTLSKAELQEVNLKADQLHRRRGLIQQVINEARKTTPALTSISAPLPPGTDARSTSSAVSIPR
jgi:RNA polymerase sigma factor (sigma-70 family)